MARGLSTSLLTSPEPCTVAPGDATIGHVQLRDVAICPHERGIITYVRNQCIVEHDLLAPNTSPRRLVELSFIPNTISALTVPDSNDTLLAAGGQDAELHLSYFQSTETSSPTSTRPTRSRSRGFGHRLWESRYSLDHCSINNSVMLTSMNLARPNESAAEPRIVVSNNDKTVKFFDIALRTGKSSTMDDYEPRLLDIGQLRLDVPVNHSSISPDGRTLLCVGDSPDVFLHRLTGGSRLSFAPIAKLSLSEHIHRAHALSGGLSQVSSIPASFSTAFSADGAKFAVASQEGVVVVWDVRSTKPLRVFNTDKSRVTLGGGGAGSGMGGIGGRVANGGASGFVYDSPWDWARGGGGMRAPGWGVRSVKFSPPGVGREVMTFTEHTSLLHVVDARTFETEEIVRMPNFDAPSLYHHHHAAPSARPRSTSPAPRSSHAHQRAASTSDVLPPSRTYFYGTDALGWPRTRRVRRRGSGSGSRDDLDDGDREGLVVISALADRREPLEGVAGDEMDVDELESDCGPSHGPSRAGSPAPGPTNASLNVNPNINVGARPLELLRPRPAFLARRESAGPYAPASARRTGAVSSARRQQAQARRRGEVGAGDGEEEEEELDLAGVCFDPSGAFVYVASGKGVAEWRVRGAEQRWWAEPEWA